MDGANEKKKREYKFQKLKCQRSKYNVYKSKNSNRSTLEMTKNESNCVCISFVSIDTRAIVFSRHKYTL